MIDVNKINFKKGRGLVPAIVQDDNTKIVLMQGYMDVDAVNKTLESKKVTFFSRSNNRLWTKGEESGNFLELKHISMDCDNDSLLIKAIPNGPTCHTGNDTCWNENNASNIHFIDYLRSIINERHDSPNASSYTSSLFEKGTEKIAQKVGEEAVELVIEAMKDNKELFLGEAADLLFHYLVLLKAKGYELTEVIEVLENRHGKK